MEHAFHLTLHNLASTRHFVSNVTNELCIANNTIVMSSTIETKHNFVRETDTKAYVSASLNERKSPCVKLYSNGKNIKESCLSFDVRF